jgi:hypothetical protein
VRRSPPGYRPRQATAPQRPPVHRRPAGSVTPARASALSPVRVCPLPARLPPQFLLVPGFPRDRRWPPWRGTSVAPGPSGWAWNCSELIRARNASGQVPRIASQRRSAGHPMLAGRSPTGPVSRKWVTPFGIRTSTSSWRRDQRAVWCDVRAGAGTAVVGPVTARGLAGMRATRQSRMRRSTQPCPALTRAPPRRPRRTRRSGRRRAGSRAGSRSPRPVQGYARRGNC